MTHLTCQKTIMKIICQNQNGGYKTLIKMISNKLFGIHIHEKEYISNFNNDNIYNIQR